MEGSSCAETELKSSWQDLLMEKMQVSEKEEAKTILWFTLEVLGGC